MLCWGVAVEVGLTVAVWGRNGMRAESCQEAGAQNSGAASAAFFRALMDALVPPEGAQVIWENVLESVPLVIRHRESWLRRKQIIGTESQRRMKAFTEKSCRGMRGTG